MKQTAALAALIILAASATGHAQMASGALSDGTSPVNDGSHGMNTYEDVQPGNEFQQAPITPDRRSEPANMPQQIGGIPPDQTAPGQDDALHQIGGAPGGLNTGINSPNGNAN